MTVRRLVHYEHPGAIETPLLLLASLREIDPTVELVHAGEARWWLGAVSDNAERRQRAEAILMQIEMLDVAHRAPRTVMLAKLGLQGFSLIDTYLGADPAGTVRVEAGEHSYDCSMVEDFRERDANWRRDQGRRVFLTKLDRSMKGPERREAEAKAREYLYTDGREQYRLHMRNRVTAGYGGIVTTPEEIGETLSHPHIITPDELYAAGIL
jgi:hypothetical protein